MKIALDAMGGDFAPKAVIKGANFALTRHPDLEFLLFGDEAQIKPLLHHHHKLEQRSQIIHTPDAVTNSDKPSAALRSGKNSSMQLAINSVKDKITQACVSGGNTGALMAMAKISLRTLPGIDRPAICSLFPTRRGQSVMLDLGANAECSGDNLFQFAIMGEAFGVAVLGKKQPTIGLLNIGSEAGKGIDSVKQAAEMLITTKIPIKYEGFIEGNDIAMGTVDIIVTDGFTGNIALKTAEGTAKLCVEYIKMGLSSSILSKIGAILSATALRSIKKKMDPRAHNGAMFLGLNGIVVKSHGGMDYVGFAHAIDVAVHLVKADINQRIIDEIGFSDESGI